MYIREPLYKTLSAIKSRLSASRTLGPFRNESMDEIALEHILSISRRRPLDINIETTSYCAFSCIFCPNKTHRRAKAVMDMDSFVHICNEYYAMGGGAVRLSSMQADVCADNPLMERIAHLKKYKDNDGSYLRTEAYWRCAQKKSLD